MCGFGQDACRRRRRWADVAGASARVVAETAPLAVELVDAAHGIEHAVATNVAPIVLAQRLGTALPRLIRRDKQHAGDGATDDRESETLAHARGIVAASVRGQRSARRR